MTISLNRNGNVEEHVESREPAESEVIQGSKAMNGPPAETPAPM